LRDGYRTEASFFRVGRHIEYRIRLCGPSTPQHVLLLDGVAPRPVVVTLVLRGRRGRRRRIFFIAALPLPFFLSINSSLRKFGSIRGAFRFVSLRPPRPPPGPLGNLGPLKLCGFIIRLDALPIILRESLRRDVVVAAVLLP